MSLAKQLGASDVLAKPFTPKELLSRVAPLAGTFDEPAAPPARVPQPSETSFTRLFRRFTNSRKK